MDTLIWLVNDMINYPIPYLILAIIAGLILAGILAYVIDPQFRADFDREKVLYYASNARDRNDSLSYTAHTRDTEPFSNRPTVMLDGFGRPLGREVKHGNITTYVSARGYRTGWSQINSYGDMITYYDHLSRVTGRAVRQRDGTWISYDPLGRRLN